MQSKWLGRLYAAAIGALLALLMSYPQTAMEAVRTACRGWATGVMPALFPYMVISQLLASSVPGGALTVPLSMLGGSPAGARLIAQAGFPKERAQRLAALCTTASPLFILGTLSGGWRMLASHWLGAAVAWGFVGLLQGKGQAKADVMPQPKPQRAGLPEIIRDAALAMVSVCGCMAFFSVLSALLSRLLPLTPSFSVLMACVLEMAGGCAMIVSLGLPARLSAALLCAAVSFGGLSIFMQNAAFLKPAGVNLRTQLLARIVHAAASFVLCYLFYLS